MVVKSNPRTKQRGLTLIELLIAIAIGVMILAALNSLVSLASDAQTQGRSTNETAYQGRFALERMADKARALTPKALSTPSVDTTGDWFAPSGCSGSACVMYCRNANNQLVETTTSDSACAGTSVIASNVTALSATLPSNMGAIDRHAGTVTLTMTDHTGNSSSLSLTMRLGGGTQ